MEDVKKPHERNNIGVFFIEDVIKEHLDAPLNKVNSSAYFGPVLWNRCLCHPVKRIISQTFSEAIISSYLSILIIFENKIFNICELQNHKYLWPILMIVYA